MCVSASMDKQGQQECLSMTTRDANVLYWVFANANIRKEVQKCCASGAAEHKHNDATTTLESMQTGKDHLLQPGFSLAEEKHIDKKAHVVWNNCAGTQPI